MPDERPPSIADYLDTEMKAFQKAEMALSNAVNMDAAHEDEEAVEDTWGGAIISAGRMRDAVEALDEKLTEFYGDARAAAEGEGTMPEPPSKDKAGEEPDREADEKAHP